MEIAKALILAGPAPHDPPWPSVKSGPKPLVPVANQPILFHNLESLRRAGVLEAANALEHDSAVPIRAAVGDGSAWGLTIRYIRWRPCTGMGGALRVAREFIGEEPVLVEPAGVLHRELIHPHIAAFAKEGLDAMALRVLGAPVGPDGQPADGGYLLSRWAVAILLNDRLVLGDPVSGVRRGGGQVRVQAIDGCLPCHGGQDLLLESNRRVLEQLKREVDCEAYRSCEFQGAVVVHPTARLDHTLIRGPAIIGPGARLSHAFVGPYTSIGANVRLEGSEIEHSIVLDGAEIQHVGTRLDSSVIGRGARVHRAFGLTTGLKLSVGDGAEVTVS